MNNLLKSALTIDLNEGLTQLKNAVAHDALLFNNILILRSQERDLMSDHISGVLGIEKYRIEKNRILKSALTLVDQLSDSDWNHSHKKNVNILTLCRNEGDKAYMAHYIDRFRLLNVDKLETKVIHSYTQTEAYDLLVFDHRSIIPVREKGKTHYPHNNDQGRLDLMEDYLRGTSAYVLHFGPYWTKMDQYRDRVHAANSIFALHARLNEMIRFILDIQLYKPNPSAP